MSSLKLPSNPRLEILFLSIIKSSFDRCRNLYKIFRSTSNYYTTNYLEQLLAPSSNFVAPVTQGSVLFPDLVLKAKPLHYLTSTLETQISVDLSTTLVLILGLLFSSQIQQKNEHTPKPFSIKVCV